MTTIWRDICTNCDLGIGTLTTLAAGKLPGQRKRLRAMLGERVLRVTVKPFMDMNTMIEERLTQCCVHVATVNGETGEHQCAPFCAVQAWAPLSREPDLDGEGAAARGGDRDDRPAAGRARPRRTRTRRRAPYDPLRLCIFATVALLGWLLGPLALAFFAVLGVVGYARARRAGLLRSRCLLGDTRNVLGYLGVLAVLAVAAWCGRSRPVRSGCRGSRGDALKPGASTPSLEGTPPPGGPVNHDPAARRAGRRAARDGWQAPGPAPAAARQYPGYGPPYAPGQPPGQNPYGGDTELLPADRLRAGCPRRSSSSWGS